MDRVTKKLWFFKSMELRDITKELRATLQLTEYYHDGEDTWEWCESYDKKDEAYFNIYREHNNGFGEYECPVILILNRLQNCNDEQINLIRRLIAKKLDVEVFWGTLECDKHKYT